MTDPQPLSAADLLTWAVVLEYRRQQRRRGIALLLLPLPPCPTCKADVHSYSQATVDHGINRKTALTLSPCGHVHTTTDDDLHRAHEHVGDMVEAMEQADSSPFPDDRAWTTEDVIRNARDCLGVPDEQAREGETPAELTAEEARDLADDLGLELYRAQDALAFVEECCVIAEREQRPITVADVREWLKGARCGRQIFAEQSARTITNNSATSADADWTQLEARAFNAVGSAVRQAGEWLPLSARRAVANAVLGAAREQIDIADEEAWCKSCRRVWDGPHHRCESDAEQRLDRIRDALAGFNDRGVWRIGHVNFDIPTAGEVIDAVRTALDQPPAAATQATHTEEQQ